MKTQTFKALVGVGAAAAMALSVGAASAKPKSDEPPPTEPHHPPVCATVGPFGIIILPGCGVR